MASVWYVGASQRRVMSVADWSVYGITAPERVWDESNNYALPQSLFTGPQLQVLKVQGRFKFDMADSGRPTPWQPEVPDPYPNYVTEAELANALSSIVAGATPRFTHQQLAPAAQWTLVHNLGIYPDPVILLSTQPDTPVWTDITYLSKDSLILTFPSPVTGQAHVH